jgi:ketosteroid isomerase-like protein
MNESNLQVAKNWLAAFNEHNLEKLLALYADDAVHYSPKLKLRHPETKGLIKGKVNLRGWWKDAFDRLPTLQYEATSLTANNERVFMEYTRLVEGEENMLVAEVLEIKNSLIVASRVYHG